MTLLMAMALSRAIWAASVGARASLPWVISFCRARPKARGHWAGGTGRVSRMPRRRAGHSGRHSRGLAWRVTPSGRRGWPKAGVPRVWDYQDRKSVV